MKPSHINRKNNAQQIEHVWVPILLVLINVNLIQVLWLWETPADTSGGLLTLGAAASLLLLIVALWRKQGPLCWAAFGLYFLQTTVSIPSYL